jgi:hypothetical protein
MRRLAKDAQKLAELRRTLQDQIHEARKFVANYCQRYNANQTPKEVQRLDEFEVDVTNRISQLDQTIKELLQIVSKTNCFFSITYPSSSYVGVCLGFYR